MVVAVGGFTRWTVSKVHRRRRRRRDREGAGEIFLINGDLTRKEKVEEGTVGRD